MQAVEQNQTKLKIQGFHLPPHECLVPVNPQASAPQTLQSTISIQEEQRVK